MICKRNHSKFHWITILVSKKSGKGAKKKKFCDYMLGYSMSNTPAILFCGDIPIGEKLPRSYQLIGGLN